jgi:hypothetical protein
MSRKDKLAFRRVRRAVISSLVLWACAFLGVGSRGFLGGSTALFSGSVSACAFRRTDVSGYVSWRPNAVY